MRGLLTDRGAATVFVVLSLTVVMFAAVGVAAVNGLVVAHRRAQGTADLAALAGAAALGTPTDPCVAAGHVALANDAAIESCRSTALDVTVVVSVAGPVLVGDVVRLRAESRAGR